MIKWYIQYEILLEVCVDTLRRVLFEKLKCLFGVSCYSIYKACKTLILKW